MNKPKLPKCVFCNKQHSPKKPLIKSVLTNKGICCPCIVLAVGVMSVELTRELTVTPKPETPNESNI